MFHSIQKGVISLSELFTEQIMVPPLLLWSQSSHCLWKNKRTEEMNMKPSTPPSRESPRSSLVIMILQVVDESIVRRWRSSFEIWEILSQEKNSNIFMTNMILYIVLDIEVIYIYRTVMDIFHLKNSAWWSLICVKTSSWPVWHPTMSNHS